MQKSQPIKGGVLTGQGNAAENHEITASSVSSSVAPNNADYAMVWTDSTNGATVAATNLDGRVAGMVIADGKTIAIPSLFVLEVFNVKGGETTITMTDI